jgi:dimethylargininase
MLMALTRAVSHSLADCALSFIQRAPIDVTLARHQHASYEELLRRLGAQVIALPAQDELPDAVFVEDTAVVVDEVAVLTAPALEARRHEVPSVAAALEPYRRLERIGGAGTLEGGDVMRVGRTLYVGLSARSNREGIAQLAAFLEPHGYTVRAVEFRECLHLKSACTYLGRDTVLANRAWIDTVQLAGLDVLEIAPEEPHAANAVLVGDQLIMPASFPRTRARLEAAGFAVHAVDVSELQKAEGAVTCCSILFER